MYNWAGVTNILCIRPDNMGDLIMSGPALRALKVSFAARITLLTSSAASGVATLMPEIDEVITFDLPWVKTDRTDGPDQLLDLISNLKGRNFNAAVIFTVFSQNPLPSAMIAYQAGIPNILAYCRENPYGLITHWVPDEEPYRYISHQVERDLNLVAQVGATTINQNLQLHVDENQWPNIEWKLSHLGLNLQKPWLILHAGVSEIKRQLPEKIWIDTAIQLIAQGYQIIFTGSQSEKELTGRLAIASGQGGFNAGGLFDIVQLVTLISLAPLLLSVNTGTVHIAAAADTPLVVLYAQTNPQHTPWMVPNKVIEFPVDERLKSKNIIIQYIDETVYNLPALMPEADEIVEAVKSLIRLPAESGQPSHETPHENQAIAAS